MTIPATQAFIDYTVEKLGSTMSPTTFSKRSSFLARASNGASDFGFINDTGRMLSILNGYDNINTRWNNLMSLVVAMKADPAVISKSTKAAFDDYIKATKEARDTRNLQNVKTDKQVERLDKPLTHYRTVVNKMFDDIDSKYDVSTTRAFKISPYSVKKLGDRIYQYAREFQDILTLAVYILQPALRSNWADMRLTSKRSAIDDEHNWVVLNAREHFIHMAKFKNVRSFGITDIDLEPEIRARMYKWISILRALLHKDPEFVMHYEISKTKHTIAHIGSNDSLAKNIPRIAKRLLGKELSINDFRHMWEIDMQQNDMYKNLTMYEREYLHKRMLHSQNVAQLYNVQDQ
jgi:hypothetical protein